MTLDPNDPKLTAYALGELDGADQAAVEKALESSAELREAVDQIRRTADLLAEHLQSEPAPALTPEQREAVLHAPETPPAVSSPSKPRRRRLWVSLAACACVLLAIGAVLWSPSVQRAGRPAEDPLALLHDISSSMERPEDELGEPLPFYMSDDVSYDAVDYQNLVLGNGVDSGGLDQERPPDGGFDYSKWSPSESSPGYMEMIEGPVSDGDSSTFRTAGQEASGRRVGNKPQVDGFDWQGADVDQPFQVFGRGDSDDAIMFESSDQTPGGEGGQIRAWARDSSGNGRPRAWDDGGQGGWLDQRGELGGEVEARESYNEARLRLEAQQRQQLSEFENRTAELDASIEVLDSGGKQAGTEGLIGSVQAEPVPGTDVLVIRGHERDVQKVMEGIEQLEETAESRQLADSAGTKAGAETLLGGKGLPQGTENLTVVDGKVVAKPESETRDSDKLGKRLAKTPTWRRAKATPNASRLMVGDKRDLPLEGMQANVTIDGFRARVL
jgi:hypothetical protein